MKRYFQGGSVAAYQHVAMLKLHYKITHALEDCLASLEFDESPEPPRRRRSQLFKQRSLKTISRSPPSGGVHFDKLVSSNDQLQQGGSDSTSSASSSSSDGYTSDDEHERGGFDGVDYGRRPSVKSSLDNKI